MTDPRVAPVLAYFCRQYLADQGEPYAVQGAKDAKAIKAQPSAYTAARLCQLVDAFFREHDPFTFTKRGPSITSFVARIPALVAQTAKRRRGDDMPEPFSQQPGFA